MAVVEAVEEAVVEVVLRVVLRVMVVVGVVVGESVVRVGAPMLLKLGLHWLRRVALLLLLRLRCGHVMLLVAMHILLKNLSQFNLLIVRHEKTRHQTFHAGS